MKHLKCSLSWCVHVCVCVFLLPFPSPKNGQSDSSLTSPVGGWNSFNNLSVLRWMLQLQYPQLSGLCPPFSVPGAQSRASGDTEGVEQAELSCFVLLCSPSPPTLKREIQTLGVLWGMCRQLHMNACGSDMNFLSEFPGLS